jgi:acetate kinase
MSLLCPGCIAWNHLRSEIHMVQAQPFTVLTLNSGSSSLKFAVYRLADSEELVLSGSLDRIGLEHGDFRAKSGAGESLNRQELSLPNHKAALTTLLAWLRQKGPAAGLQAVGHRVVHGGTHFNQPCRVTAEVTATLRQLIPLAPNHLPSEIQLIEAVARRSPDLPQVACFDTAFHRTMPPRAQFYPLPRQYREGGVQRYGFHGLSYQFIVEELRRLAGPTAGGRSIIAHLGNGASMAAVQEGRGVDTTMGMTPLGGLVMGTRAGDLDPGVVLYLLREKQLSVAGADDLLNKQSGLLGLSGVSPDMKDLLGLEGSQRDAALAVEEFCYQARKFVGALAAALGGLDTLVFTAGIGEHAPPVRARICAGLEYMGVRLDASRNEENAAVISAADSLVTVRVIPTNEELMIARQTRLVVLGPA